MKKILALSSCFLLGIWTFAHAQLPTPPSTPTENNKMAISDHSGSHEKRMHHGACMKIAVACESAGYRLSKDVPGKNIRKDCVKPILDGQTVAGVQVDSQAIQQCKEGREKMKEHMQKREAMQNGKNTNSTMKQMNSMKPKMETPSINQ